MEAGIIRTVVPQSNRLIIIFDCLVIFPLSKGNVSHTVERIGTQIVLQRIRGHETIETVLSLIPLFAVEVAVSQIIECQQFLALPTRCERHVGFIEWSRLGIIAFLHIGLSPPELRQRCIFCRITVLIGHIEQCERLIVIPCLETLQCPEIDNLLQRHLHVVVRIIELPDRFISRIVIPGIKIGSQQNLTSLVNPR